MDLAFQDVVKILMAVAVGGAIGFEREFHDKAAGFRTLIFICLGATLFTMWSLKLGGRDGGDPTRIAADIVTGVGFIGAGVILREGGRVVGLTTAAAVWLVAALGMGIGAAEHALVLIVTAITLVVLWLFPMFERWVDRLYNERNYEIVFAQHAAKAAALETAFRAQRLRIQRCAHTRDGDRVTWKCVLSGSLASHERLTAQLLADPEIEQLRY